MLDKNVYKQVEFITRIYAQDSKKYKKQAEYWLAYAFKLEKASRQAEIQEIDLLNF